MWPKWLADTLDRSAPDMRSKGGARPPSQNVNGSPDVIDPREAIDPGAIDWDEASGFDLHAGYGAERTDT